MPTNDANRPPKPRTHSGDLARLPAALSPLTDENRWVNWSWETRRDNSGNTKWTKPPRRSRDLGFAQSNKSETWGRYEQALRRVQDGDADGIGFMLLGSGIGAADLDHCCKHNAETRRFAIDTWARDMRGEANGAYCEVTVSGTGLRLIGTATEQECHRSFKINHAQPDAQIELFRNTARFITVSGLRLGACQTLPPIDDFIDAVIQRYDNADATIAHNSGRSNLVPNRDWDAVIRNGAEPGERSELFQGAVWHLANRGLATDEIEHTLAEYPGGIAERYIAENRLHREVGRSYQKWRRAHPTRLQGVPIIKVVDGQIARMVDEAQDALAASGLPIFTGRGLVEPITIEREAADGRTTMSTILSRMDEYKISYLLNKHAVRFERLDKHSQWCATNPPHKVATMLLSLKDWHFPEVIGIVGAPTMRPDGSLLTQCGYDPATRLWCDADMTLPEIPERPTRQQAAAALRLFKDLLSGFAFVSATDLAVALAAILTVVLRGAFDLCPMFLIVAHDIGNGKSFFVDLMATLITGRPCPVISPGETSEETEKRLGAILLEGGAIISLDNMASDLESALLCQILTQHTVKVRRLGVSEVPECEWRGTIFATGNNVRVLGDLIRRALTCNLDAKMERPELREFAFNPIARVLGDREAYIAAAITIARAYRAVGRAASNAKPLAGYAAWSATVREPLLWLGEHDPVQSMEAARTADPNRAAAYELVSRWKQRFGLDRAVSVREVINTANRTKEHSDAFRFPLFRQLLVDHAGTPRADGIDPNRLGIWLRQQHGRVYAGFRLDLVQHRGAANKYALHQIADQD
jgi:putative DNA primase/helicase